MTSPSRFRVEIAFSPGAAYNPVQVSSFGCLSCLLLSMRAGLCWLVPMRFVFYTMKMQLISCTGTLRFSFLYQFCIFFGLQFAGLQQ